MSRSALLVVLGVFASFANAERVVQLSDIIRHDVAPSHVTTRLRRAAELLPR